MDTVTKHFCHDALAAQKVDLKTVRLLFRTRFRIDAANVFF